MFHRILLQNRNRDLIWGTLEEINPWFSSGPATGLDKVQPSKLSNIEKYPSPGLSSLTGDHPAYQTGHAVAENNERLGLGLRFFYFKLWGRLEPLWVYLLYFTTVGPWIVQLCTVQYSDNPALGITNWNIKSLESTSKKLKLKISSNLSRFRIKISSSLTIRITNLRILRIINRSCRFFYIQEFLV